MSDAMDEHESPIPGEFPRQETGATAHLVNDGEGQPGAPAELAQAEEHRYPAPFHPHIQENIPIRWALPPANLAEVASIPHYFRRARAHANDLILISRTRAHFYVNSAIVCQGSTDLRHRYYSQIPLQQRLTVAQHYPFLEIAEDTQILAAVLMAITPLRSYPIPTYDAAKRTLEACTRLGVDPALLRLSPSVFLPNSILRDPFGHLLLAWTINDWSNVQFTSRYTHRLDLVALLRQELSRNRVDLIAFEVLLALFQMRGERTHQLISIAESVPLFNMLCEECRAAGRLPMSAVESVIQDIIDEPFPFVATLREPRAWCTDEMVEGCRSEHHDCRRSILAYRFPHAHFARLAAGVGSMLQCIDDDVVRIRVESTRSSHGHWDRVFDQYPQ